LTWEGDDDAHDSADLNDDNGGGDDHEDDLCFEREGTDEMLQDSSDIVYKCNQDEAVGGVIGGILKSMEDEQQDETIVVSEGEKEIRRQKKNNDLNVAISGHAMSGESQDTVHPSNVSSKVQVSQESSIQAPPLSQESSAIESRRQVSSGVQGSQESSAIESRTQSKSIQPKCAWVSHPVDLSAVVPDLGKALSSQQLETLDRKSREEKRQNKAEELRSFLKLQLGDEAFHLAVSFSRSIATLPMEDDNTDDDYLLTEMEEILGADGLRYLDDIFTLITLEDEWIAGDTRKEKL